MDRNVSALSQLAGEQHWVTQESHTKELPWASYEKDI